MDADCSGRSVMRLGRAARLLSTVLVCTHLSPGLRAAPLPARPNIIVILMDDLRWDEMDYPFVRGPNIQRIARDGVRFTNAFVTTPLCSPSRASILTGHYAHKHGITDNTDRSKRSHELLTFPRLLHDAGYETAFIGKWHMGLDDSARPGIDHWVSVKGQGSYLDPEFNVNGKREMIPGYFSDILNRFALDFLKQEHAKPYLLYVSHKAVHPDLVQNADGSLSDPSAGKFIPAERHEQLYAGATIPHRSNYGRSAEGKPALRRSIAGVVRRPERTMRRFAIACECSRRWTKAWVRLWERLKLKGSWTIRSSCSPATKGTSTVNMA